MVLVLLHPTFALSSTYTCANICKLRSSRFQKMFVFDYEFEHIMDAMFSASPLVSFSSFIYRLSIFEKVPGISS